MKRNKAFTLIELVSVLVILAILALIVTPLVLNIIRKARIAADKRSIDAYGRSIELAVADYLLEKGTFPTSIEELTIEYSGNRVVCETTQLNGDSSVYLSGCTVNSRTVDYVYGKEEAITYKSYSIGDEVTYNGIDYYVIADSGATESTVTLLKAEPLTVEEVNTYGGVGTANNHVNMYVTNDTNASYYQKSYDYGNTGYGGMTYFSSTNCGYNGNNWVYDGCTTNYADSDVKYVIDAWKSSKAPEATSARLITLEELINELGFELNEVQTGYQASAIKTPNWIYGNNYSYWTMSPYEDSTVYIWYVYYDAYNGCKLGYDSVGSNGGHGPDGFKIRPVIVLNKSASN